MIFKGISRALEQRLAQDAHTHRLLYTLEEYIKKLFITTSQEDCPRFTLRCVKEKIYIKGENKIYSDELTRVRKQIDDIVKALSQQPRKVIIL
jgi:hypothetical protein